MAKTKKTAPKKTNRPPRKQDRPDTGQSGVAGFSRTRKDHQREHAEDYVELIATLLAERGEARAVDMAHRLGVSHVTVTRTLSRLKRDGLIHTEPYRAVFLTSTGEKMADRARSRHSVVLEFLLAAGVHQATATIDAEGIEHHVSPETLEILKKLTRRIRQSKI